MIVCVLSKVNLHVSITHVASVWAVRQVCDLAFHVGRGLFRLVPHQPCFGVLTAGTRGLTRSPRLCGLLIW